MNMNKILLASGLCIMLVSTGCSAGRTTRYRASLNDGRVQSPVTRSFDGYRNHNNFARNRFGSPIGRGYNVRNFSRFNGSRSAVNGYTHTPDLNTRNTRNTRNTKVTRNIITNELDSNNKDNKVKVNENRKSHNINVRTEKTENKLHRTAPAKASEKQGTHRSHQTHEKHQAKKAHNTERLNKSAETAGNHVTRSSGTNSLARGADVPGTAEVNNNRGRNAFGRYNGLLRNSRALRSQRRSNSYNGYIENYNHGNGLIRDYRFNEGLRNDGFVRNGRTDTFIRNHNYDTWNNGLYSGLNEGFNNGFNNDLTGYSRYDGFTRNNGLFGTGDNAPRHFSNGATFVGPTYAGPYYAGLGMVAGS